MQQKSIGNGANTETEPLMRSIRKRFEELCVPLMSPINASKYVQCHEDAFPDVSLAVFAFSYSLSCFDQLLNVSVQSDATCLDWTDYLLG